VYTNADGCKEFGLAPDRMGDLIVVSEQQKVLGTSEDRHDLSGLEVPLRSHGGVTEQRVPLVVSQPVHGLEPQRNLRNFDIYDVALNHTQ
jgi:phosphonoacetate hydrolase